MSHPPPESDTLVRNYLKLRTAIGVIGLALPPVLALLGCIALGRLLPSISAYYYLSSGIVPTARDVFVGSLFALGVFLWAYRGPAPEDRLASNVASVSAVGIALFPTRELGKVTPPEALVGWLHVISAAVFFLTLAYMSLRLFRRSNKKVPTPRKLMRNKIYEISGYAILLSLALIAVVWLLPDDSSIHRLRPVFWLESAAIWAFGVSWLVKGEAILKDEVEESGAFAEELPVARIPE